MFRKNHFKNIAFLYQMLTLSENIAENEVKRSLMINNTMTVDKEYEVEKRS